MGRSTCKVCDCGVVEDLAWKVALDGDVEPVGILVEIDKNLLSLEIRGAAVCVVGNLLPRR